MLKWLLTYFAGFAGGGLSAMMAVSLEAWWSTVFRSVVCVVDVLVELRRSQDLKVL
jgi:hypothetical protein